MNTFTTPLPCSVKTITYEPDYYFDPNTGAQSKNFVKDWTYMPRKRVDHWSEPRLLHGFGEEGSVDDGLCICALVESPDGTFDAPAACMVKLLEPTPMPEQVLFNQMAALGYKRIQSTPEEREAYRQRSLNQTPLSGPVQS